MTIRETTATVFVTEDGEQHATKQDALDHQFAKDVERWARANCYTGMTAEDVVNAIVEDKVRLAAIFKEYGL